MVRRALIIILFFVLGCNSGSKPPQVVDPPPQPPICNTYYKYITWKNPTTYTDNTAIDQSDQAELITEIELSFDSGESWLLWASVENGEQMWEGDIEICKDKPLLVRARSTIKLTHATGAWSEIYEYILTP